MIATAEGYLAEVADLLNSVKNLVVEAANTGGVSRDEIEANQLQIDSAIDSITRISNVASFAGLDLLNGSLEYTASGMKHRRRRVLENRQCPVRNGEQHRYRRVRSPPRLKQGNLWLSSNTGGFTGFALDSDLTLEIAGKDGAQDTYLRTRKRSSPPWADAFNLISDSTGVEAVFVNSAGASGLRFVTNDLWIGCLRLGPTGRWGVVRDSAPSMVRQEP